MEQADFGERLRLERGKRGYTVDALSKRSGVSTTQITNIENGEVARPRIQTVIRLANGLSMSPEALLGTAPAAEVAQ